VLKKRTLPAMKNDPYKVLGVDKAASQADIKKAFRSAAKKHHPDKGGDAEEFKKINEAYEVLGDEQKRTQYDQFGSTGASGSGGFSGGGGFNASNFDFGGGGMEDIFSSFFGGGGSSRGGKTNMHGADLEVEVVLDFDDAMKGVTKKFSSTQFVYCEACDGKGGSGQKNCSTCSGSGRVSRQVRTPFGIVQQKMTCSDCEGTGKMFDSKCSECSGEGRVRKSKKITIKVPTGVQTGETLRVRGEGEAGRRGGEAGDLFVHIQVRGSRKFERHGMDIVSELKLSPWEAILGGKFKVETFWGEVMLEVLECTKDGTLMKIRGKGVNRGGRHGDHLARIVYDMPRKLSKKEREVLEKLK
jgi:molecular chaperone DnaJ